ncbi:Alpha/Beta hydrolase protein [Pholiota molesta]|nr:Alpha/Beta hydrolase protein [Pholiota molesta]
MAYPYRKQPIKSLYWLVQLVTLAIVRFPLWIALNIPRWIIASPKDLELEANSPGEHNPESDGHISSVVSLMFLEILLFNDVESTELLVTGDLKIWADIADVSSIRIPGYWIHKKGSKIETGAPARPGEKVILQFHGGAYIRLSAHPKDPTAHIAKGYVKELDSIQRVFSLEYRLTSGPPFKPVHPFPTQLIDALAGYNYLVNVVGFAPENIFLSGDSAGGLILLSPWIDMGITTQSLVDGSATTSRASDYIGDPQGDARYAKAAFSGPHGLGILETNPYISPASLDPALVVDFKKFPPTFIVAGGAEVLYDSIITLKERMAKDLGDKVRYFEAPDGVHDYLIFTWHEPERTNTMKEINQWLKTL